MNLTRIIKYTVCILIIFLGFILYNSEKDDRTTAHFYPRTYAEIKESGVLRAVTDFNSISYYITDDTIQGFDYELLHVFARNKQLKLELVPEISFEKRLEGIITGKYDILAAGTVITSNFRDSLLFTHPLLLSKQVLVQRKKTDDNDSCYIDNQLKLAKKTIYTSKNSPAILRINNLMDEIGDTIYIQEIEHYGPEQLIAMVAEKDIDYAVCDQNIAEASTKDFPNIDIHTDIGFNQFYAWGVNKTSSSLLDSLNCWLDMYKTGREYETLYKKYFH